MVRVLNWNEAQNIRFYRVSSGIIPLASHPGARWPWRRILAQELLEIGRLVRGKRLRVSMHPGQYTVLNSPRRSVVGAARAELLYHTDFLDHLRLDATHKIVVHVGGLYGNRNASLRRFRKQFRALPANVKARLVLENDERNYGTEEVLALSDALGVPMVFDCFHHIAHAKELPSEKLLARVYEAWSRNDGHLSFIIQHRELTQELARMPI